MMNITENTRIKSGTLTHEGRKFLYTMIINPVRGMAVTVEVYLIVHNTLGTVVDSMQRTYSRIDRPYMTDVVKAALAEFKEDRA